MTMHLSRIFQEVKFVILHLFRLEMSSKLKKSKSEFANLHFGLSILSSCTRFWIVISKCQFNRTLAEHSQFAIMM